MQMSRILWKVLLLSPVVLGVSLVVPAAVLAEHSLDIATNSASITPRLGVDDIELQSQIEFEDGITEPQREEDLRGGSAVEEEKSAIAAAAEGIAPDAVLENRETVTPNSDAKTLISGNLDSEFPAPLSAPISTVLEQIDQYSSETSVNNQPVDQVTSVSQLSDVQPTDWAFQALQSLVERYGCIAGYPDGTYRGNRAMTRYEFAAGLNACLERVNELIAAGTASLVSREDLAALQKLQEEFAAELATLRGRVDALEARTAELEANQFSTTTKLNGEVIFALTGIATGDDANGDKAATTTAFASRVRLNFDTSFSGEDLLRTRLQVINLGSLSTNSILTADGELRFNAGPFGEASNTVVLDALLYSFPIGERTTVVLEANAGAPDDFMSTVNPFFDGDGGSGAISNFGTRNPIYYLVGGAGIGITHQFSDRLELSLGYLASDAANPARGGGLFNGPYGAIAQLTFTPSDNLAIGLTYVNSYNSTTGTGSNTANYRSFLSRTQDLDLPISSNSYGIEASWQFSPRFALGGWVGYTTERTLSTLGGTIDRGDRRIWNWAVTLAFPDLLKEGNVAGILVGMEPKVTHSTTNDLPEDKNTSLHVEAFYQFQLSDNISITPGIIWLTAPDHNNDNSDLVIGVVRTTFTF